MPNFHRILQEKREKQFSGDFWKAQINFSVEDFA